MQQMSKKITFFKHFKCSCKTIATDRIIDVLNRHKEIKKIHSSLNSLKLNKQKKSC